MLRYLSALALALGASGCAWANRENRPAWNVFEEHLVPENDVAFAVTLPLTAPGGLVTILLDTLVFHPAQVIDDAARDTADLWDDPEWSTHYYSELASLPLRGIATPLVFTGSFVGRSLFDVGAHRSAADQAAHQIERERDWIDWFDQLAARQPSRPAPAGRVTWSDALQAGFVRASQRAGSLNRIELYRVARHRQLPPCANDPALGLRDHDPVVRFRILQELPPGIGLDEVTRKALLADSNEAVRDLARRRWSANDE